MYSFLYTNGMHIKNKASVFTEEETIQCGNNAFGLIAGLKVGTSVLVIATKG